MFFHRSEVAVIMQQDVAMLDAESADDDVRGLADGDAQRPQLAIIAGGTGREITIEKRYDRIPAQSALDALSMGFVPGTLKDLEQDKIADQQRFTAGCGFQFGNRRRSMSAQVRDPDGAINEDHE